MGFARHGFTVIRAVWVGVFALAVVTCLRHDPPGPAAMQFGDAPADRRTSKGQAQRSWFGVAAATPRDRYEKRLDRAYRDSLDALRWKKLASASIERAHPVALPMREVVFMDPSGAAAEAYAISLQRGQRLVARWDGTSVAPKEMFMDLLATDGSSFSEPLQSVAGHSLIHDVRQDGVFVLRLQPQLYRGGRFQVVMEVEPSLQFPVQEHDSRSVQSYFGAPRERGARQHHGIDIFAPRGTPVLAAADALVARVSESRLGGNVVWLREAGRNLALYYAHLDERWVRPGQWVAAGEPVGTVGNTGNARYTKPHLHFGIYHHGPIDPYPYVRRKAKAPAKVRASTAELGEPMRLRHGPVALRTQPQTSASVVRRLSRGEFVVPVAARGDRYRVRLPDETVGYLAPRALVDVSDPLRISSTRSALSLRSHPFADAPVVVRLAASERVAVLATFDGHLWLESVRGLRGWVSVASFEGVPREPDPTVPDDAS